MDNGWEEEDRAYYDELWWSYNPYAHLEDYYEEEDYYDSWYDCDYDDDDEHDRWVDFG